MPKFVITNKRVITEAQLVEAIDEDTARYSDRVLETQKTEVETTKIELFNDGIIKEADLKTVQAVQTA
jgi:hypothetical protein